MSGTNAGYYEIVLAAWLHDIERLADLAGSGGFLRSAGDYLPGDTRPEEVIRLIQKSQTPEAGDEWLIAHALRLSLGASDGNTAPKAGQAFFDNPLAHLVSVLRLSEKDKGNRAFCFLRPLDEYHAGSPFVSTNPKIDKQEFGRLWQGFSTEIAAIKGRSSRDFALALDTLLERYFWCIPALSDSSLSFYQQAKISAAFAGALYQYHKTTGTGTIEKLAEDNEQKFLFINGDMSGIQKYIFDLKQPADNAKLLRARSFQLWALSEIIAENLSVQFGVSRDGIITSAGGKFLLLAPNTGETKAKLKEARLSLERYFLREFAGKLTFILSDGIPASGNDFRKGTIQNLLNKIGTDAEWAKQRKMQAALSEDGAVLESLYDNLQRNGECKYCETLPNENAGKEKNLCRNCAGLVDIGGRLLHANGEKIILKTDEITSFNEMVKITGKDDPDFGYTINQYKPGSPLMFLPYTAPMKDERRDILKTFEDIAELSAGNKKLAMFKADIDNLGLIFTSSPGGNFSLPAYAGLSRQLHYFFSGYLADFISNHTEYKEKIYTVFSGGDDVCVIGAWDTVMRFAPDFRNTFKKWANNNPSLTLSGGIALSSPDLPVRNIAEEAEAALEEAKGRKDKAGNTIKDGVSVFGVTVSWEEYAKSLDDAETILKYLDENKVTSAVVYKMIDFANRAKRVRNGNLRDMLWMSNYRYTLARNIKAEHTDTLEFFRGFGVSSDTMEKSRIAVSYALYANRKSEEE